MSNPDLDFSASPSWEYKGRPYSTETKFDTVAPTKSSVNFKLAYKNNGLIT